MARANAKVDPAAEQLWRLVRIGLSILRPRSAAKIRVVLVMLATIIESGNPGNQQLVRDLPCPVPARHCPT
jgi:hypothetical protein